jgi:hypothetical protein
MSFEVESNSELTVIVPAYQLHFWFLVQNKIHKQKILSDTRTGILGSIDGPCDFLPAWSAEFQKVCRLHIHWLFVGSCRSNYHEITATTAPRTLKDHHYFCRFELENMSIDEILPALDLIQSIYDKICIGMHQGSNLKFPDNFW